MLDIFKNIVVGSKFKTRDNRRATLESIGEKYLVFSVTNKVGSTITYDVNPETGILSQEGKDFNYYPCDLDIIGPWFTRLSDKELDRIIEENNPNKPHPKDNYEAGLYFGFQDGFKACYNLFIEQNEK